MNKTEIIDKLKKLKALKERGVGGEAGNAERILHRLCEQYGIDIDNLDDEKRVEHAVVSGCLEYQVILSQIVWTKVDRNPKTVRCLKDAISKKDRKILDEAYNVKGWGVLITCTDSQFTEVMFEWEILKDNYEKRKQAFLRAFLECNDLLLTPTAEDLERQKNSSNEDEQIIREAARYSAFMDKAEIHKAIES